MSGSYLLISIGLILAVLLLSAFARGRFWQTATVHEFDGIQASIQSDGKIQILKDCVVQGDVEAQAVSVEGRVEGSVRASDSVEVRANATVLGDIRAPRVVVAEGATFTGAAEFPEDLPSD